MRDPNTIPFKPPGAAGDPPDPQEPQEPQDPNAELVDQLRGVVDAAIAPVAERLSALERRTPEPKPTEGGDPSAPPEPALPTPQEYFEDPVGSAQRISEVAAERVFQRLGAAPAQITMRTALDQQRQVLEADPEEGPMFGILREDFDEYIRDNQIPEEALAQVGKDGISGYRKVWDYVKGKNLPKILAKLKELADNPPAPGPPAGGRRQAPFVEGGSPRGEGGGGADAATDDEKEIARALGVPIDEYLKTKRASQSGLQSSFKTTY